jgi:hypothetical protein
MNKRAIRAMTPQQVMLASQGARMVVTASGETVGVAVARCRVVKAFGTYVDVPASKP